MSGLAALVVLNLVTRWREWRERRRQHRDGASLNIAAQIADRWARR